MLVNVEEIRNRGYAMLVERLGELSKPSSNQAEERHLRGVCDGYRHIVTMFDEMIASSAS